MQCAWDHHSIVLLCHCCRLAIGRDLSLWFRSLRASSWPWHDVILVQILGHFRTHFRCSPRYFPDGNRFDHRLAFMMVSYCSLRHCLQYCYRLQWGAELEVSLLQCRFVAAGRPDWRNGVANTQYWTPTGATGSHCRFPATVYQHRPPSSHLRHCMGPGWANAPATLSYSFPA